MFCFMHVIPESYPFSNPLSFSKVHSKLNVQPNYKIFNFTLLSYSTLCTFITVTNESVFVVVVVLSGALELK